MASRLNRSPESDDPFTMSTGQPVILIDPEDRTRDVLIERLRMQGYRVTGFSGPVEGANAALGSPPSLVIADLWMPGISGVQLTRLLRAEAATERVPVLLRGPDNPRNRFWAERAGAAGYVVKGRMGDLVRAIARSVVSAPSEDDGFFTQLQCSESAFRDRIAAYLDAALFESVLAAEVRSLSTCGAFDRLFDLLTQFVSQVMSYRWLALAVPSSARAGLHTHPASSEGCESEIRQALALAADVTILRIEDEDAFSGAAGGPPMVRSIEFGGEVVAQFAISQKGAGDVQDARILDVIARELGGPLRMSMLVEETHHAATTDPLTGIMNRRAMLAALDLEQSRSERHGYPMSLLLLDVDHFKAINDGHGHAMGDKVLSSLGRLLSACARRTDLVGRWGGEEFVVVLAGADEEGARIFAERLRRAVEDMEVLDEKGQRVLVRISIGIACLEVNDSAEVLIARADRAMYQAKTSGRNRVVVSPTVLRRTGTDIVIPEEFR
jgi:two-component system, cell cycle response regulator